MKQAYFPTLDLPERMLIDVKLKAGWMPSRVLQFFRRIIARAAAVGSPVTFTLAEVNAYLDYRTRQQLVDDDEELPGDLGEGEGESDTPVYAEPESDQ